MPRQYIYKIKDLPEKYQRGFLVRMDAREVLTRQLQAAYIAIVEDTGGPDAQTHLRLALVERAVFLEFQLQKWERELLAGKAPADTISRWIQAINAMLGLAKTLGLNRSKLTNAIDALYGPADDESSPNEPQYATKRTRIAPVEPKSKPRDSLQRKRERLQDAAVGDSAKDSPNQGEMP
jgi:hypothetical protein